VENYNRISKVGSLVNYIDLTANTVAILDSPHLLYIMPFSLGACFNH